MRIAIMGSGGVGGYFGGRLAAAGEEVHFIARGAHLQAMLADGLRVKSPAGDMHIKPCRATGDPAAIGPVDAVLFATKLYDVESAAEACRPLVGPDTVVVSLLNGLDSEARLAAVLGEAHVAGGVAAISAAIERPGVIGHYSGYHNLQFGELPRGTSPRLERLLEACQKAGIEAYLRDDIQRFIWQKLIFLAPFAGVASLARAPAGLVRETPETRALLRDAIAETVALARVNGQDLGADAIESTLKIVDGLGPGGKPSMLVDLERGNRLEVAALNGLIHRMSEEKGLAAPVNRVIAAALAPYAAGSRPA